VPNRPAILRARDPEFRELFQQVLQEKEGRRFEGMRMLETVGEGE